MTAYQTVATTADFEEGTDGATWSDLTTPQGVVLHQQYTSAGLLLQAAYTSAHAHTGALAIRSQPSGSSLGVMLALALPPALFPDLPTLWAYTQTQDPASYPADYATYAGMVADLATAHGLASTASAEEVYAALVAAEAVPVMPSVLTGFEAWVYLAAPGGSPSNQDMQILQLPPFLAADTGDRIFPRIYWISDHAGADWHAEVTWFDDYTGIETQATGATSALGDSAGNPQLSYGAWVKFSAWLDGADLVIGVDDGEVCRRTLAPAASGDGTQVGLDGSNTQYDWYSHPVSGAQVYLYNPTTSQPAMPTFYLDDLSVTRQTSVYEVPTTPPPAAPSLEGWGMVLA